MSRIIVFQSDFTYKEGAVAAVKGVIKAVARDIEVIDATHEIPQYDIYSASYRLRQYVPFWPQDTIFLSVVDPGVGTGRKACVARLKNGAYVVTPDNGTLSHLDRYIGIESVREIDETINRLHGKDNDEVAVFHGRDLFGYCAARLAAGIISYEQVGPEYPVKEIVSLTIPEASISEGQASGIFEIMDPNFGNLWTNIPTADFAKAGFAYGDLIDTTILYKGKEVFHEKLYYYATFALAPDHSIMIYHNELNRIALAEVVGNLAARCSLGYGVDYQVIFRR